MNAHQKRQLSLNLVKAKLRSLSDWEKLQKKKKKKKLKRNECHKIISMSSERTKCSDAKRSHV